jgi:hypothetical protein
VWVLGFDKCPFPVAAATLELLLAHDGFANVAVELLPDELLYTIFFAKPETAPHEARRGNESLA